MSEHKPPPYLKIVERSPERKPIERVDLQLPGSQHTLFARSQPNLIIFVQFEVVNESDFLAAIINARPKYVLDLRFAPRFDLGSLNRRLVFSVFQQVGAQYYDVAGKLAIRSARDTRYAPPSLINDLRTMVFRGKSRIEGPIAFLVGNQQADERYETSLVAQLDAFSDKGWEILRVPSVVPDKKEQVRDLLFISHAAPEDNDFARWLGAHLSALGYKIWSDVTRLIGGEEFWDDIEDAIRTHSAKVVVCLSRVAQTKKGVLDEIACAVGTERSRGLDNFVIPIRLDDLPFTEVRANIGRKNIIDFNSNWATGLSNLVRVLERDGIPRPIDNGPAAAALMARLRRRSTSTVTERPEPLFTNWLRITSLPDRIVFVEFDGPIHDAKHLQHLIPTPSVAYHRLIGGFALPDEIQTSVPSTVRIQHRCTIPTSNFLHGHATELPGISAKEAGNQVTSLLRQSWDNHARKSGLLPFTSTRGTNIWFPPKGLITGDVVQFEALDGVRKRKTLVGWSDKRKVFWHFAVELIPALSGSYHFILRPHVLFTEDGRTPLRSVARMHSLRRGFCKSWWNDRWRDLIAAFVAWLAGAKDTIKIPVSASASVDIDAHMMELTSPVTLVSSEPPSVLKDRDLAEPDWTDDPELDESEIAAYAAISNAVEAENASSDDDC